jgi:amidohydrolase
MTIKKEIKSMLAKMHSELISVRRHLHANPELSFKEKNTSAFIQKILKEQGIAFKAGFCKYGIVAEIQGKPGTSVVYLRGDMDALPILETNDVPYRSLNKGIMHACGHDVHTTCVLGAAIVLNKLKDKFEGKIRIIFQPGEEKLPGGASIMIKEGAVKKGKNTVIYGQHVHPPLEAGSVGFYPGQYMASADELYIKVIGKGGHAALPQDCIDTILVASKIVSAVHQIVPRYSDPKIPTVISLGKINSVGGASNIIPDIVNIEGTMRTMDEANREHLHTCLKRVVSSTAKSFGAKAQMKIKYGYPCLMNDEELTLQSMEYAREYLGNNNVVLLQKRMTAEDFSFYSQMMPACFYRLGTGNKSRGIDSPVHTSSFDIDEKALKVGVGLMAFLALRRLNP